MNLFASMILQSFIRLVIYIDQFIVREDGFTIGRHSNSSLQGIDNTVSSIIEEEAYLMHVVYVGKCGAFSCGAVISRIFLPNC